MKALLIVLAACLCLIGGPSVAQSQPTPAPLEKITFVGDMCFDGGPGHTVTNGDDPFASVASLFNDSDISVGNLVCSIADRGHRIPGDKTLSAAPESLNAIKKYFTALSVANDHTSDWGNEGFVSLLEHLESREMRYFGGGRNIELARRPALILSHGRRIALLGYCMIPPEKYAADGKNPGTNWLIEDNAFADIRAARSRDRADFVIPYMYWGRERAATPSADQVRLARKMIDAGADAVMGSHSHVPQTLEWYHNKPIVYSLGNFVFRYFPYDPPVYHGWVITVSLGRNGVSDLKKMVVKVNLAGLPEIVTSAELAIPPELTK